MSQKTPRHADWRDWFRDLYEGTPWKDISTAHRMRIVGLRLNRPDVCPSCGRNTVMLHNLSREYRDDDTDYEYACGKCFNAKYRPKKSGECFHGQNLKPWSELKRRARVARIRKLLPMPGSCQYCDNSIVELVSRSGTWPEDQLSDYVWVCRTHAVMIEGLQPAKEPEPVIANEPANPEMFPWWYNNTMSGTFQGSNIIGLRCVAGRFL
jgi:ribosomal protein S27AE